MRYVILSIEHALNRAYSELDNCTTTWTESKDWDYWSCAKCGVLWAVPGGDPEEMGYEYCPSCGREIEGFEHYALDDGFPEEE